MLENNLVALAGIFALIIACAALLLYVVIKIKSAKKVKQIENYGKPSEKRLKEMLEKAFSASAVFSGIYIPYTNGEKDKYAEMDAVLILRSGVFVIELKSHNGKIINDDTKYWTQIYNDKRINFYNPIYQNSTHSKVVNNIFKSEGQYNVPIYNVVVFSSNKVTFTNEYPNLVLIDDLIKYIKKTGKSEALSIAQTSRLRTILRSYIRSGRKVEQKHKRSFRKRKRRR